MLKKTRNQTESEKGPTSQLVTFELDKEEYAAVITDLREIIKIPEIVPIPNGPDFIRGIVNLRGQIVVIIDLEKRFNLVREHATKPQHIIITEVEENVFGIIVDEVTGVVHVPVESIKPTPKLVSTKIHAEYLKGVVVLERGGEEDEKKEKSEADEEAKEQSRLLLLLDVPKMLTEKELLEFGNVIQKTVMKGRDHTPIPPKL
jgi:purine-binding chemotaxis protein CheW